MNYSHKWSFICTQFTYSNFDRILHPHYNFFLVLHIPAAQTNRSMRCIWLQLHDIHRVSFKAWTIYTSCFLANICFCCKPTDSTKDMWSWHWFYTPRSRVRIRTVELPLATCSDPNSPQLEGAELSRMELPLATDESLMMSLYRTKRGKSCGGLPQPRVGILASGWRLITELSCFFYPHRHHIIHNLLLLSMVRPIINNVHAKWQFTIGLAI